MDTVRRKLMLVTVGTERVKKKNSMKVLIIASLVQVLQW